MLKRLNKPLAYCLLTLLGGCAASTPSLEREKYVAHQAVSASIIYLPKTLLIQRKHEKVPFYGVLETKAGAVAAPVNYVGGAGAAGFLGQIFAHAAISNQAQHAQLSKEQDMSNQVLSEYNSYIERITSSRLLDTIMLDINDVYLNVIDSLSNTDNNLVIDSRPIFYLSQDKATMIIEHQIQVAYVNAPKQLIFENSAKIVSPAVNINQDIDPWLENNGQRFLTTTSQLYSDSLTLLVKDMYQLLPHSEKQRTYKYYIGNDKSYMRGNIITDNCNNVIIRNLQGNVAVLPKENTTHCVSQ